MNKTRNFAELQRDMTRKLRDAGCETATLDARLLLSHLSGLDETQLAIKAEQEVPYALHARARRLVDLRANGKPVAKITGYKEFWGRRFCVSQAVLDPRPDSETLIEAALPLLPPEQDLRLIDLGTGSGCLLLTLLAERPRACGLGIDKSPAALRMARRNAHLLGLRRRVALRHGNWLQGVKMRADIIIANPPYIKSTEIAGLAKAVRLFDPHIALDGGTDGLGPYRHIIKPCFDLLKKGGDLLLEIGASQANAVSTLMADAGFDNILLKQDLAGRDRVLQGQKSLRKIKKGFEK